MNPRVAPRSAEAAYALWDELADFPAAQADAALTHLMKTLCGWSGAIFRLALASGASSRASPRTTESARRTAI